MELILGAATGFFMQNFIPVPRETKTDVAEIKKGPMEIFRESIRDVVRGHFVNIHGSSLG